MIDILMDFETKSRAPIRDVGGDRYAADESTGIICVAFAERPGPGKLESPRLGHFLPDNLLDVPNDLEELRALAARSDVIFHAYNAAFEAAIWREIMVKRYGFAPIPAERWRCTAAHAATYGLPRGLDKVGSALGLAITKDNEGKKLMLKHARPKRSGGWHENINERLVIHEYCRQDVRSEAAILDALPPWDAKEEALWVLDQIINARGIPIDLDLVEAALDLNDQLSRELRKEFKQITRGSVSSPTQVELFLDWLANQGLNLGNLQADTVDAALAEEIPDRRVRRALEIRRTLSKTSVSKYKAMKQRAYDGDRVRGSLMYYGAHTGRWAGRGVQFQNVPRGNLSETAIPGAVEAVKSGDLDWVKARYGDAAKLLSATLRPAVRAEPGKALVVADYAGIENRGAAFLSQDAGLCAKFREPGFDPYVAMAQAIYPGEEISKDKRLIGKIAVLGLGYGMGAKKFRETCGKWGVDVSEAFAEQVVKTYRTVNKPLADYWYALQRAAVRAVRNPTGTQLVGPVGFRKEDRWLYCRLPSGRKVAYMDPLVTSKGVNQYGPQWELSYMGEDSLTRKWKRQVTWGGKLCENVVQAFARDLLADAIVKCEAAGLPIVMTVHDEIVIETGEDQDETLEKLLEIMRDVPKWARGCPVDAEGFSAERYRK